MLKITDVLNQLSHQRYSSGQDLANKLNVTRATIHNCISRIESLGIKIERLHGQGYRLAHALDLLSPDQIVDGLSKATAGKLEKIECLQEVDSTNHLAAQLELPPAGKFSVVLAESQHAGKGRRGRAWISPCAANLYLSLLWPLQKPLHAASVLSPYLAMQLARSLQQTGIDSVGVKWPNDIYCRGKKLAGILIECAGELSGQCKMIIGVGLNVYMSRYSAINIDQPWTDIASELPDSPVTRNELAAILVTEIVDAMESFEQDKIQRLSCEWPSWDIMKDKPVSVQSDHGTKSGTARGINNDGSLVLETSDGKYENIMMGELSIRSAT